MKRKFLSILMAFCLALSLLPTAAFAEEGDTETAQEQPVEETAPQAGPSMTADVPEKFTVGVPAEFSFTTHGTYTGGKVTGGSNFSDEGAFDSLKYKYDDSWVDYPIGENFGGEGFDFTDGATSTFQITFTKPGKYTFEAFMYDADDKAEICSTGVISFTVNAADPVAEVDGVGYATLKEAVDSVTDDTETTIKLLKSVDNGDGIIIPSNKNITIDFGGFTYTVTQNLAGSSGSQNQCFQLLKDSDITLRNGAIVGNNSAIQMMIQNYSNLTLDDMTLDATKGTNSIGYVSSNNCGEVRVTGNTTITAKNTGKAFDVSYWPSAYPAGTQVVIDTTGTITGDIEIGLYGSNGTITLPSKSVLSVENVNLVGDITTLNSKDGTYGTGLTDEQAKAAFADKMTITGGKFSSDVSAYVPADYECVGPEKDGTYTVQPMENKLEVSGTVGQDGNVTGSLSGDFSTGAQVTTPGAGEDGEVGSGSEINGNSLTVNLTTTGDQTDAKTTTLTVTATAAQSLKDAESLTVNTDAGDVTFNAAALDKMGNTENAIEITVTKNTVSQGDEPLASYTVTATANEENLLPDDGSETVTVTITVDKPTTDTDADLQAWYVNNNMYVEQLTMEEVGDKLAITIHHLSTVVLTNGTPESGLAVAEVIDKDSGETKQQYTDLQKALNEAQAGDTVKLLRDVTVSNEGQSSPNEGVFIVPDGVTLDGNHKTITATNWKQVNSSGTSNHILSVNGGDENEPTTTIKNLTIVGAKGEVNSKAGVNAYNGANVVLENVDISNCGSVGVQVNGATVTVNGGTIKGNGWGGINVDSKVTQDSLLTVNNANIEDESSIYVEHAGESSGQKMEVVVNGGTYQNIAMTNSGGASDTITVTGGAEVTTVTNASSAGSTVSIVDSTITGTSPTEESNVIVVNCKREDGTTIDDVVPEDTKPVLMNGETYDTLSAAITALGSSTEPTTIYLLADVTESESVTIPVGANITIEGKGNTLKGTIACTATASEEGKTTKLTLNDLTLDGKDTGKTYGITSQNQDGEKVSGLDLTMNGCTVKNYASKGIYLTNAISLTIDDCTFENNATGQMGSPNISGDYTIDLNLVGVDAREVKITNTTFTGDCGDKAVIKVAARGGASDEGASDINGGGATLDKLTIAGCTFNDNPAAAADVNIGTDSKKDSGGLDDGETFAENTTGAFAVEISSNKTAVMVNPAYRTYKDGEGNYYLAEGDGKTLVSNITVPAGQTATKTESGDMTIETPVEPDEPDRPSSGGSSGGSSSSGDYLISVDKTTGGTVRVNPGRADRGDTVTITVKPNSGYELDELVVTDKNGDTIRLTDKGNDKYTFKMPGSKVTVEATFVRISEEPEALPFVDVPTGAYYYDAVAWAVENGVTNGTSATTFGPDVTCTRAQMVTFLWRAAGSPEPETTVNPFTDVSESAYYYEAVLWAVERGITNGTSATTFSPDATVTRGQTVTFLWRDTGSPAAAGTAFTDVAVDAYYTAAVSWAANEGITSGTSATTFSPDNACTRAQIVTFLYRAQ